jgi:hypothetical protein
MPTKKHTTPSGETTNNKTHNGSDETFSLYDLANGVKDLGYVEVCGDSLADICPGDVLIIDQARTPEDGDLIVWENRHGKGRTVGYYREADRGAGDVIRGVATALVRRFRSQTGQRLDARKQTQQSEGNDAEDLRQQLSRLERVPENEAERFRLETEIYRLKNKSDEWPDEIAA